MTNEIQQSTSDDSAPQGAKADAGNPTDVSGSATTGGGDDAFADAARTRVPLLAVGASAGGLEAFQLLVKGLPERHRFAVVLVQHLDPDHDSLMPELISAKTDSPVHSVTDGMVMEGGHIYLIPPGFEMEVEDDRLRLLKFETPRGLRRPIDRFFRSVSEVYRDRAMAVVLSGTGSDGSVGAREIKGLEGLVFVQDPGQAKFDGMPRAVLDMGAADLVLRAEEIADVAREYLSVRDGIEPVLEDDTDFLLRILRQVRFRTGHDFSNYKTGTMMRRIAVRMSVLNLPSPTAYLQHLVEHKEEADHLFHDLLINVTSFFRDPDHFDTLARETIPDIVARTPDQGELRIWSVGCSTGEETYTLAILIAEEVARTSKPIRVAIFGTDIDDVALAVARRGHYRDSIAESVPEALLERYFKGTPEGYEVTAPIREMVRFSRHSFIKDPPFSKLDLVICRNVLIYLNETMQDLAMRVFHYALQEGGFLFLGSSENPRAVVESFVPFADRARIFQRRPGPAKPLQLGDYSSGSIPSPATSAGTTSVTTARADVEKVLRENHLPPHIHVGTGGRVIDVAGDAARYLSIRGGAIQTDIMSLILPELESAVRRVFMLPETPGSRAEREFQGELKGTTVRLVLSAERLSDGSLLLVFHDRLDLRPDRPGAGAGDATTDAYINKLEEQLDQSRDKLRTTVEELETSNEELKSSNEEMMSLNEELQSANEELTTINDELQQKLAELSRSNSDLANFMRSAQVPTVFLDHELRLLNYTPEAEDYFSFGKKDVGRPLTELATALDQDALTAMCERCMSEVDTQEADLVTRDGESVLRVRITPSLSNTDDEGGCVITLTDITELTQALDSARTARAEAERRLEEVDQIYRGSPMAMGVIDRDLRYVRLNARLAEINGLPIESQIGATVYDIVPDVADDTVRMVRQVFETGEEVRDMEIVGSTNADRGVEHIWRCDWVPFYVGDEITAVAVTVRDVTEERETAANLRRVMQELEHRVKNMLANVVSLMNRARRESIADREVYAKLTRRIESIAKTHSILMQGQATSASIRAILAAETSDIYDPERVTLSGPNLSLNSRATVALGMTIHELATNAAKYGAFANAEGHVSLKWSRVHDGDGDRVRIVWQERGGPPVEAPAEQGFGSQLIDATIVGNLDGEIAFDWEPDGLTCVMSADYETICGQNQTS